MYNISKFDPFKELKDLGRKFQDITGEFEDRFNITSFKPAVNTREDDKTYYIEVDLPGIKKEDITIDIHDNVITISGERNHKEETEKEDYYMYESSYGKFERSFTLPENVSEDDIKASNSNGVLEVIIPKSEGRKVTKKVDIL